jgi:hypothetical protein
MPFGSLWFCIVPPPVSSCGRLQDVTGSATRRVRGGVRRQVRDAIRGISGPAALAHSARIALPNHNWTNTAPSDISVAGSTLSTQSNCIFGDVAEGSRPLPDNTAATARRKSERYPTFGQVVPDDCP